jgi:hypothetical protein
MTKKDDLKKELARRLSTRRLRTGVDKPRVDPSEILDRREAAKLARLSENHFTNGLTDDLPNCYLADETQFGPSGLMLFLREDVERRLQWRNDRFPWPPQSDEPSPAELIRLLEG